MDHIPLPRNPRYGRDYTRFLGIEYSTNICRHTNFKKLCEVCQSDERAKGWKGFPQRMYLRPEHFHLGPLVVRDISMDSSQAFAALMQAWLFFGAITDFFESFVEVRTEMLVRIFADGSLWLDTTKLIEFRNVFLTGYSSASPTTQLEIKKQKLSLLQQLTEVMELITAYNSRAHNNLPNYNRLSISAAALFLTDTYSAIPDTTLSGAEIPTDRLTYERLRAAHWCPSDISRLSTWFNRYYASQLGDRKPAAVHENCNSRMCAEISVDEEAYVLAHASPGCSCSLVSVPVEQVVDIIHQDRVPCVSWDSSQEKLSLSSFDIADKEEFAYTAISHVWADGTGNPKGNSIHKCLAEHLHQSVQALQGLVSRPEFQSWFLDTLCVPVTRDKRARKKAISMMNSIYKNASRVMIWDAELLSTSTSHDILEASFRIMYSRWSSRLWTLQEALANDDLFVRFRNTFLSYGTALRRLHKLSESPVHTTDEWGKHQLSVNLSFLQYAHRPVVGNRATMVMCAALQCVGRKTSNLRDELICIAGMSGFSNQNLEMLLDHSDDSESQVSTFVTLTERVPCWLAMVGDTDRLQRKGFRWCPRRLIAAYSTAFFYDPDEFASSHKVTQDGLLGPWKSIRISLKPNNRMDNDPNPVRIISGPSSTSDESDFCLFKVHFQEGERNVSYAISVSKGECPDFWSIAETSPLAFLWQSGFICNRIQGLVVAVDGIEDNIMKSSYISAASCTTLFEILQITTRFAVYGGAVKDESMEQIWCIS